ncbi:MAG: hypothetical protein ACOC3I_05100, partial [Verrucomicrobiota bacterium]
IDELACGQCHRPGFLDLATALDNSRKQQTTNTPAVSTVFLAAEQVEWMLSTHGDLDGVVRNQHAKAETIYGWAEQRSWARPFVADPAARSLVVAAIDLDENAGPSLRWREVAGFPRGFVLSYFLNHEDRALALQLSQSSDFQQWTPASGPTQVNSDGLVDEVLIYAGDGRTPLFFKFEASSSSSLE